MNTMQNKITIYRGSHQIGGCATEISTGKHRVIIDFGANLPDNDNEDVMTDEELTETVFDGRPCDGVLFTHYHGDHMGLYKKIPHWTPICFCLKPAERKSCLPEIFANMVLWGKIMCWKEWCRNILGSWIF